MYFVVHVAGRVLRFVDYLPDGEAKCIQATEAIPGARYELQEGFLPRSHEVEEEAAAFRDQYMDKLANKFLDSHGYDKSGVYPKLKVVV